MNRNQSIHLLLEETARPGRPGTPCAGGVAMGFDDPGNPLKIEIPEGVSYVMADNDKHPCLRRDPPNEISGCLMLEPIRWNQAPQLLLLNMGRESTRVNGKPAPPVTLLVPGDEVLFSQSSDFMAHVALFSHVVIGPSPAEEVGRRCAICLMMLTEDSRAFVCSGCGRAFHLDSDDEPEETRRRCARQGRRCPICATIMDFHSGYTYLPECFQGH